MKRNLPRVLVATVILVIFITTGWRIYKVYSPLPDWIFLIILVSGSSWLAEYIRRLLGKAGLWGSVRSRRDKIVAVCSLVVMWTCGALPLRLGIASEWITLLVIVTVLVLGYAIWRYFGSPDITRPDRSRSGADDG